MTLIAASSEYLLEAKIQEKNDAKARIRESERPERMRLLAGKKHLGLADWIEITGIGVAGESHYKISKEGIRFIGWDEEAICSSPSDDQPNLIRQNEEPGFPCTPRELLNFVDSDTGSMFGSFIVPDEFRKAVIQIEQTSDSATVEPHQPTVKAKSYLTKRQVITAFEDLHFNADKWSKYIATPPQWLEACRWAKGNKSTSSLWSPVAIAIALTDSKRSISVKKLDAVFVAHIFLKQWVDEWREASEYLR